MKAQLLLLSFAALAAGCKSGPPLPPADLSAPGWHVQHGQAVWRPGARRPELAGDLLVATNANGDAFVQFVKDPFPLATAQLSGGRWQMAFGTGQHAWRGRSQPPRSFLWLQLPAALRGQPPCPPWRFIRAEETWRMENPRRGEWLEGRFIPESAAVAPANP